jgi:hypothetical protein
VGALYKKIEKDPRHKNIIRFFEVDQPERIFNDWSMGHKESGNLEYKNG